jgi:hypothetical protein
MSRSAWLSVRKRSPRFPFSASMHHSPREAGRGGEALAGARAFAVSVLGSGSRSEFTGDRGNRRSSASCLSRESSGLRILQAAPASHKVSPQMKILIILIALSCQCSSQDTDDPFAEASSSDKWPQRISPTDQDLRHFKEPVLKGAAPVDRIDIRFIWVPSFNRPFAIRATRENGAAILRVARLKGKGGYDWGAIETERSIKVSEEQWKSLISLVAVDGAREPSQKAKKELRENFVETMSGLDGSTWFLEVRDQEGYTVEGVPNPIIGDPAMEKTLKEDSNLDLEPFLAVCMKLFALSGLDEKPTD